MGRAIYFVLLLAAFILVIDAHVTYKRRPEYSFYTRNGNKAPINNIPGHGHRRVARAAMPIPRRPTALPATTTTVSPATQVPSIEESGYCQAWSQQHYRSFDGKLFSFHGACTYTLVTDCLDFSFHIYVENDMDCQDHRANNTCSRSILIDNGNPSALIKIRPGGTVFYNDEELTLPTKAGGIVLERIAHYTLAQSGLGFTILYDGKEGITIYATSDSLVGNTCGLCGVLDDDPSNDFRMPSGALASDAYTFGLSWKGMDERDPAYCPDVPTVPLRCTQYASFENDAAEKKADYAETECAQLRHGTFSACHQVVDPEPYIVACEQDVCSCEMLPIGEGNATGNDCKCAAFTAYTQECARRGFQVSWRSYDFCPFNCPVDKVYDQCGSACTQKGCSTAIADCETDDTVGCLEGCHCPAGTYRSSSGECVNANQCFCSWQGNEFEPGKTISDGCNECECTDGKWVCSQNDCGGMCQVSGQGHYHTFDSYDYDFAGTCTYTLVKDCWSFGQQYMVNIENAECGMEGKSCVKAVILEDGLNVVRLRRGLQVMINGQEVSEFPKTAGNIYVNKPTHHQLAAVMSNGLTILFDGNTRVVVMADERHLNATCGLCGTYNNNQRDDFYTEAGDIESNPSSFANKWKLGSSCPDANDDNGADPCDLYSQKAMTAELECNRLYTDDAFAACRQYVDPEVYYESCRSDVCNCETGDSCKCEIFAMYATQCAQKGVVVNWRSDVPGCGINCEGGLVYSPCHPMCETTCNALSSNSVCDETCVEGCACPDGSVMAPNGACVAPDQCGCVDPDTGETYAPGETVQKGCGSCTCDTGAWECLDMDCPMDACLANQEYSLCVSPCVKTCSNMHEFEDCSAVTCYGGCVCTAESVWNGTHCVLPTSCPCHHGGHSYSEGFTIQTDECHSCTCTNSKWECKENNCHGVCTAWGDPHFKSFDGRIFDFQGDCDYVLVTDSVSQASGIPFFHIVIGNVPCGTTGVTCTKSITFTIGNGGNQEKLQLVRGKPVPSSAGSFRISIVGAYVYVHTNLGITLLWDQGTWTQVKLDPMYKGKVGGLCGNFNDLVSDDFLSPAGGLPETSSIDFGNSWKVHDYCPRPSHILHPCLNNPFRRAWAMRQCSVIKSELFQSCHSEVNYRPFYTRCVFDTCGCDSGGDCECLCTAISAYAQECNAKGVPVSWRSNDLCPIQCDGCREYDPCIPVCNVCGHEDRWNEDGECPDTCVEGCSCPEGQFYDDGYCVDACPTTTPPTTTPYITTTPPWTTTTEPSSTPPPTTTQPPSTTTPITTTEYTSPPYTPPYNVCHCSGYGDPHYKDFNDNHFDHQGNCSYILSQDTADPPVYTVIINNVECERFPGTTCPKDIKILYDGFEVILLAGIADDGSFLVVVNNMLLTAPVDFRPHFQVYESGFFLVYEAMDIGLSVRFQPFDNFNFHVEVPQAKYEGQTQGLCGNCGHNDSTCVEDDNCCDWVTPPEDKEVCGCGEAPTTCPPIPIHLEWCEHIYDPVFAPCHAFVDPDPYFHDCVYDDCFANDTTCWAFEAYATECSMHGICLEWRGPDFCPADCLDPFEYRQCACPIGEFPSCEEYDPGDMDCHTEPVSGCYCPVGTMPINNSTCVPCPTPTVPTTTPPETTTPPGCEPGCRLHCHFTIWFNNEGDEGLLSSALKEEELLVDAQHSEHFPGYCHHPHDIECRTVDTQTFSNQTDDDATCTADVGLRCVNRPLRPRCRDYEVRYWCCEERCVTCTPPPPPPPTTRPPFTPPPPPTTRPLPPTTPEECVPKWYLHCFWSVWYNDEAGKVQSQYDPPEELELLSSAQSSPDFPQGCVVPQSIECRTVDTHEFSNETDDASSCDVATGLRCENHPLRPRCHDYEVRYFCCEKRYTVTCEPPVTPPPVESTTTRETPTPGCREVEVCKWSEWCNDEEGGGKITPHDIGEFELLDECRETTDICDAPTDIECEMAARPYLPVSELRQDVTCNVDLGLICLHSNSQPICLDYRVRFQCCHNVTIGPNCPTTKPSTPRPPTTPVEITTPTVPTTPPISTPAQGSCTPVQRNEPTTISYLNCTTVNPVYLNECAGSCPSNYAFDKIINGRLVMDEYCSCCKPSNVIEDTVELECSNGSNIAITIPVITSCSCHQMECASGPVGK